MPIAIEGGRIPALLKLAKGFASSPSLNVPHPEAIPLRIALVNNMPDAALEDTEFQFFELLSKAAGDIPVSLKFFSLPDLPRNELGQKHLNNFYSSSAELLREKFDGAIITGTEPRSPDLRDEPYWPALVEVMNWAENKTSSTVLSCLAAHAGVLASDQIPRSPLAGKQFGVFEYKKLSAHPLTAGIGDTMRVAHSRWNESKADALSSHGYEILTQSPPPAWTSSSSSAAKASSSISRATPNTAPKRCSRNTAATSSASCATNAKPTPRSPTAISTPQQPSSSNNFAPRPSPIATKPPSPIFPSPPSPPPSRTPGNPPPPPSTATGSNSSATKNNLPTLQPSPKPPAPKKTLATKRPLLLAFHSHQPTAVGRHPEERSDEGSPSCPALNRTAPSRFFPPSSCASLLSTPP